MLESFSDRRTYSVEQEAVTSLASAFQQLEKCKSDFNVEDYSLSQTTLEQVGTIVLFLDFLLWCWRTQTTLEQVEINICDNCTFPWFFAVNHTDHPWTRWRVKMKCYGTDYYYLTIFKGVHRIRKTAGVRWQQWWRFKVRKINLNIQISPKKNSWQW